MLSRLTDPTIQELSGLMSQYEREKQPRDEGSPNEIRFPASKEIGDDDETGVGPGDRYEAVRHCI
jgi:hypothetical protein